MWRSRKSFLSKAFYCYSFCLFHKAKHTQILNRFNQLYFVKLLANTNLAVFVTADDITPFLNWSTPSLLKDSENEASYSDCLCGGASHPGPR